MGSFFYDDQAAIRSGLDHVGFDYRGTPVTPGFERVRQPATAINIGLTLDNGQTAWGDIVSVPYSGAAGRDRIVIIASHRPLPYRLKRLIWSRSRMDN